MFREDSVYRSLFSNMLNGLAYCRMVYEADKAVDFIYLMVNEAFYRQTGLPDVVGRRATEVIPTLRETDADLFEVFGRAAETGKPECFERYVAAPLLPFSALAANGDTVTRHLSETVVQTTAGALVVRALAGVHGLGMMPDLQGQFGLPLQIDVPTDRPVAVLDFDVHHGNGTQDIFYDDASVLYASTHQMPLFPGTPPRDPRMVVRRRPCISKFLPIRCCRSTM